MLLLAYLAKVQGLVNVTSDLQVNAPQVDLHINRDLATRWAELVTTLSGSIREQAARVTGIVNEQTDTIADLTVKQADEPILAELARTGLLLKTERHLHNYPFCWRCDTPLIYYATPSWYVRTTQIKDRLLAVNEGTNWYPEHVKHGRYGDWLDPGI